MMAPLLILGSRAELCLCRVNFKTRRSAKLPDDFVKRYAKFMTANYRKNENNPVYRSNSDVASSFGKSADSNVAAERVRLVPNKFNAVVRRRHFVVCPSDCDFNMHTSNVVYVRFCFDCATLLTSRGGSEAGDDIGALRVRRILSRFVGESRAGDVICVTMWPDELRTDALHFRLTRDEDTLFEMTVDFYENLTSLHFWREQIPAKL
jgi:acyl-CoA thioesterase FadM